MSKFLGAKDPASAATAEPHALHRSGIAAASEGRLSQAIELLEEAVRLRPDFAQAHNDLGVVLGSLDRLEEAAAAFRAACRHQDGMIDAHLNLGSASQALGRLDDAVAAYSRVVEADPTREEVRIELARMLRSQGRAEEAVSVLEALPPGQPASAALLFNRGVSLQAAAREKEAESAFRRCIELDPDFALAYNNLGCLLRDEGKLEESVATLRRAVELRPDLAVTHMNLGVAQLARGEAGAALSALDRGLSLAPGNTRALALKAVAHRELGDRDATRRLLDFDRFVRRHRVQAPEEFSSLEDFNAALARHVLEHPTLMSSPDAHATRKGRHSGNLLVEPKGPMAAFEAAIQRAVVDYANALSGQSDHPFPLSLPRQVALQSWGVVLGAGGHQIPHIHPGAWLSGVYYVQVPGIVDEQASEHAGWLEFGRPHPNYPCTVEPEVETVKPECGLMVLFPAYFYHHTIPFDSQEIRISIAFDVCRDED